MGADPAADPACCTSTDEWLRQVRDELRGVRSDLAALAQPAAPAVPAKPARATKKSTEVRGD